MGEGMPRGIPYLKAVGRGNLDHIVLNQNTRDVRDTGLGILMRPDLTAGFSPQLRVATGMIPVLMGVDNRPQLQLVTHQVILNLPSMVGVYHPSKSVVMNDVAEIA